MDNIHGNIKEFYLFMEEKFTIVPLAIMLDGVLSKHPDIVGLY